MSNTPTQADADVMEASAKFFEQTNDGLKGTLDRLMGQLEPLMNSWKGAGALSFSSVMTEYNRDMATIKAALSETAELIRTSGKSYATTDEDAASGMANIRSGIELPLGPKGN